MRSDLARRFEHGFVCRVRTAIEDVFPHRPMQQGCVLRDHADVHAQTVLRHLANRLAVDQNAPGFHIVEAEKEIHHRRFTRAGPANQTDALTRPDGQVKMVQPALFLAIVMTDIIKVDLAAIHHQWFGARFVLQVDGGRNRLHPLGNHAEVLEERRQRPHDPHGHGVEAQHQR